jgi:hypothetical protein
MRKAEAIADNFYQYLGSNFSRDTSDQTTQYNRASTSLSPRQLSRLKMLPQYLLHHEGLPWQIQALQ